MRRSYRIAIGLIVIVLSAITATLFIHRDRSLTTLQKTGTLRVGYAVEPPYAFLKPGGAVSGEFPVVAGQLASRLGIQRIEWVQTDFDALIPALESGRFDVIAAGMYITRERAQRVAFSNPLLHVQQGLLVRTGNPHQIYSYQQAVSNTDVKLAVISGAVEEALLRHMGVPDTQIVAVPDARTGRTAVESGVTDGLALSSPTIRWMAAHDELGRTAIAEPFEQPDPALTRGSGYTAFAFRPADRQLLVAWNTALQSFVNSIEHRGIMAEFGFAEAELPGAITTQEVLLQ